MNYYAAYCAHTFGIRCLDTWYFADFKPYVASRESGDTYVTKLLDGRNECAERATGAPRPWLIKHRRGMNIYRNGLLAVISGYDLRELTWFKMN